MSEKISLDSSDTTIEIQQLRLSKLHIYRYLPLIKHRLFEGYFVAKRSKIASR